LKKEWLKDRLAIEEAVAEVSRIFLSPDRSDLNEVLSILGRATSVNRTHILRLDADTHEIVGEYEWCSPDTQSLKNSNRTLNPPLYSWLIKSMENGESVMIPDVDSLPSESSADKEMLKSSNIRSLLAIPIYSTTKSLVGLMSFENNGKTREWLGEEVQTFRVVAIMVSIHWERKEALMALEKSEKKYRELYEESRKAEEVYRSLISSSADAIVISDMEDKTRYISPSFIKLFGWTLQDVEGEDIPFIPETEKDGHRSILKDIKENGTSYQSFLTKRVTKEGRLLDVSLSASRYYDHERNPAGILYILRDISDRKKLEAQLLHAQKMEAIGTLAGGIAHDFNNNLQAIFGCTEILLMGKDPTHPDYSKLETIEKSAQRASNLTRRLLVFGREMKNRFEPVDLNNEVDQVLKILERTIPKMIHIQLDLEKGIKKIEADPGQLEQIMMNLGVNARDAMPEGGKLIFKTRSAILDKPFCSLHPGSAPGEYVLLTIADNGSGMEREILEHIFEPFFTTKQKGEGTGLGLAMVYGIVKSHRAYITCLSEPGRGTTFEIYFPVMESGVRIAHNKEKETIAQGGYETILLVDDEETNRELGKEILSGFGYNVITASDGENAFRYYLENIGKIDLVILDLIMPGRGGRKLLDDLMKIDNNAKVIIASGYAANGSTQAILDSGAKDFISKPYDIKMMLKAVRRALG